MAGLLYWQPCDGENRWSTIRRMRKVCVLLLLVAMTVGCTAFPEKKHPDWKNATRSERINELFWNGVANKHWDKVKGHVAPLAVMTEGETRTTGVNEIIARLQTMGITAVQIGEVESQPAGIDLVTTYTLAINGQPPRRVMAVWQPLSKRTVLIALSVTVPSQ